LSRMRLQAGLPEDPVRAFRESGYAEKIARERSSPAPNPA